MNFEFQSFTSLPVIGIPAQQHHQILQPFVLAAAVEPPSIGRPLRSFPPRQMIPDTSLLVWLLLKSFQSLVPLLSQNLQTHTHLMTLLLLRALSPLLQ
jgi:hypothetical protein